MKKFDTPEINVNEVIIDDVITTSGECLTYCDNKGPDSDM